jgi:hypothetical protein
MSDGDLVEKRRLEALGKLLPAFAQDMRNLVGIVGSYADFAARATTRKEGPEKYIGTIREAARRAGSLTEVLHELSTARPKDDRSASADVHELVTTRIELLRRVAGDVPIEVVVRRGCPDVHVAISLEHLLFTLCVAVRDAQPGEPMCIELGPRTVPADLAGGWLLPRGEYVSLRVSPPPTAHVERVRALVHASRGALRLRTDKWEVLLPSVPPQDEPIRRSPSGSGRRA